MLFLGRIDIMFGVRTNPPAKNACMYSFVFTKWNKRTAYGKLKSFVSLD